MYSGNVKESQLKEHFFASGSISDPRDGDISILFDKLDVVLGIFGKIGERFCLCNVLCPSWQLSVNCLAFREVLNCRRHASVQPPAIKLVVCRYFECFDAG